MTAIRKIGFIGVGNMGNPMAANLLKGGFDVTVFDARAETAAAFVAQHGGKAAASLADLARGADAIVTMLPDDKIVRKVMLDAGGAAALMSKDAVLIDMGTCDPTGTRTTARPAHGRCAGDGRRGLCQGRYAGYHGRRQR